MVINGSVHRLQYIWDANSTKENWGFLLAEANNAFKEINKIIMLWRVCNSCPYGAHFKNCYCHDSLIIPRNGYGTANIIHSREDVTQGDSLDMVVYWIGVLLISAYPDSTQTWYADNDGALRTFDNLEKYFNSLKHHNQDWGY